MQLSPKQDQAIKEVDHWFKHETGHKQVFRLFGCAGTGKSTLARFFAENIDGVVKFATFTGKAAHVMEKKGCIGATTIHRLIYQPKAASKKRLFELEEEHDKLKAQPEIDYEREATILQEIAEEKLSAGNVHFALNRESDLRNAHLLIIDEVSMVGNQMGKDLESFGRPILVLGDPEQLPPIFGSGYFTDKQPDIMLDEIHRQALDNPIIRMSQMIREGKDLPLGQYGTSRVIDYQINDSEVLDHEIILTGLRKTKKACDDKARKLLNRLSPLPMAGDKMMCVKNNHEIGLLNGQTWTMVADSFDCGNTVSLHIREEATGEERVVSASKKLLMGISLERNEHERDIEEFEYAYGITVHKSQGSQYSSVLLFDQKNKFPNFSRRDQMRWLYTGVTRAAERVTVMRL